MVMMKIEKKTRWTDNDNGDTNDNGNENDGGDDDDDTI